MVWLLLVTSAASVLACVNGIYPNDYHPKYGTYIGPLSRLMHGVTGDIFAINNITMRVVGFNYDGEAPDAYFFAGNKGKKPSNRGFIISHEKCTGKYCRTPDPLGPARNAEYIMDFPITRKGQRSFNDIKWVSVWCRKFAVDFGHVFIPKGAKFPNPMALGPMRGQSNSVYASNVIMEDTETLTFQDFNFDDSVNDAILIIGTDDKREYELFEDRKERSTYSKGSRNGMKRFKMPKEAAGSHLKYVAVYSPSRGMISQMGFPHDMRVPPAL